MSVYTLPDLPYDYSALEPHISGNRHPSQHPSLDQVLRRPLEPAPA
ncbi:hypothetical protein [Isoptericola sp. BMS4]|nr:hypothetical protein [Isoptericola sp. BMS4]